MPSIDSLLRRAARSGLRRGLSGEHWAWFAVALAAYLARRVRRPGADTTTVDLRGGARYLVTLRTAGSSSDAPSQPSAR